jgi:hypothetical protein
LVDKQQADAGAWSRSGIATLDRRVNMGNN